MNLVIVVGNHPTLLEKLVTLFLLAYPLFVWSLARMRRREGPMSASAIPAALTPLFAGVAVSWTTVANVMAGQSITVDGGRMATAAGAAEALVYVMFSAVVAAVVCGVIVLADRSAGESLPTRSFSSRARTFRAGAVIALALLLGILIVTELVVLRRLPLRATTGKWTPAVAFAAAGALGAAASLTWLVASRRAVALQCNTRRRLVASICTLAAALLALAVWRLGLGYNTIAGLR